MNIRRVVAGTDARGKSVFLSDGPVPHSYEFRFIPGHAQARVWFTREATTKIPEEEPTGNTAPVIPEPGGASFVIVRFAPDAVATRADFDAARAGEEFATYAPDLAEASDPAEPGMHRTRSVDYGVVLDGEIWLELDDGAQTRLTPGDTVVQIAGRHAWRNRTDRTATMAFVLTGAHD